jgi:hypothetical protein
MKIDFTYHSFVRSNPTAGEFRQGNANEHFWLIGASTRSQVNELLRRLEKVVSASQTPTQTQLEQVCDEFIGWYRVEYQKAKQEEYDDEKEGQILRNVSVVWANSSGQVTVYRGQTFWFCQILSDGQLIPVNANYETLQLTPNTLLVASPADKNLATRVRDALQAANWQWEALEQADFTQPVAVLKAEYNEPAPFIQPPLIQQSFPWKRYALPALFVLLTGALLGIGYNYRGTLVNLFPSRPPVSTPESVRLNPDSTIRLPTNSPTITKTDTAEPALPKNKPTVKLDTLRPPAPVTNKSDTQVNQQLNTARQTLALAEFFRKKGQPVPARKRYLTALSQFKLYCQIQPSHCTDVASSVAIIEANLRLLDSSSEF